MRYMMQWLESLHAFSQKILYRFLPVPILMLIFGALFYLYCGGDGDVVICRIGRDVIRASLNSFAVIVVMALLIDMIFRRSGKS